MDPESSDQLVRSVLAVLRSTNPQRWQQLEHERLSHMRPPQPPAPPALSLNRLEEMVLEPAYVTTYNELVHDHAAIYLPAYFIRHLRHLGATNGLRFMALRQMAYRYGFREACGTRMLLATSRDLSRWSTLSLRHAGDGMEDPGSYFFLLAGKVPYYDYYLTQPASSRWEDAGGYHWKSNGREFCIWKKDNAPTNDCSQLGVDRVTGEPQWRQAPTAYRVQLSMPLCPEDEQSLRAALLSYGAQADPLNAIRQCLALPRRELIPDRPARLDTLPPRLYTVPEVVMEIWGGSNGHKLASRVAAQSRLLEAHLIGEGQLLKIPFYLLEKWGAHLSAAQLWTVIVAMDRVYAGREDGEYRDTTVIPNGIKEMTLWTEDQYTKGAARKITKWLYPFTPSDDPDGDNTAHFNPWFSVFVSEILAEKGARARNPDNSVQMKLRVLPLVPLCPEDTLYFAHKMGLERLLARDARGQTLALEITPDELAVYLADGRTLRYSHQGKLQHGEDQPVTLYAYDRQLNGIELFTSEDLYDSPCWPVDTLGDSDHRAGALSSHLETGAGALSSHLGTGAGALSSRLETGAGALSSRLALDSGALFCMLLKLLILNLYGIKQNAYLEKPPSTPTQSENIDSLEQFGSRQGQFMRWEEVQPQSQWDFSSLVKTLGITDVRSLKEKGVTGESLVCAALELYAIPAERFSAGRIAVLVAKLRISPIPQPGACVRLAELGPEPIQDYLRRAIISVSPALNDPDWNAVLGRARRNDLIELAEKLGLGRVFRDENR